MTWSLLKTALLLFWLAFCLAFCAHRASGQARTAVIDGVEYRLFTADEMRDLLTKLKERELLIDENKELTRRITETDRLYRELVSNKDQELKLVREKLSNERDYWRKEFEAERQTTLRLESIFRSCSGRILWLFRICRL